MNDSAKPPTVHDRMLACFRMADLTPREQIILAIIASFDGHGGAYPSLQTIADMAGISRNRASATVTALHEKGAGSTSGRASAQAPTRWCTGNPAVTESVTAEQGSCRHGDRNPAVTESAILPSRSP